MARGGLRCDCADKLVDPVQATFWLFTVTSMKILNNNTLT